MYVLLGLFTLLGVPAVLWLSSLGTRIAVARLLDARGIGRLGLSYSAEYSVVPLRKRVAIQVSGHLTSYLICVAVLLVGTMGAGRAVATREVRVLSGPAMDAGMRDGDVVIAVAGTRIHRRHLGGPELVLAEQVVVGVLFAPAQEVGNANSVQPDVARRHDRDPVQRSELVWRVRQVDEQQWLDELRVGPAPVEVEHLARDRAWRSSKRGSQGRDVGG